MKDLTVEEFLGYALNEDDEVAICVCDGIRNKTHVFNCVKKAVEAYGNWDVGTFDIEDGHICINVPAILIKTN